MLTLKVPQVSDLKPRIAVIGVGGAGGNAVNNMIASGITGVDYIVANTDAQALIASSAERRIQLGATLTEGLGAGAKPERGAAAAEEAVDEIKSHLANAHMVFIAAGMGGGTGTGAAPIIARVARELGILTVAIVTKPFEFEGLSRMRMAEAGIAALRAQVDTMIVIPNHNLFRLVSQRTSFKDAFRLADDVLISGVSCITELIVKEGLINLDLADVKTVLTDMGTAMMGTGVGQGEHRALQAAEMAIMNPLLDDIDLSTARGLIISIVGGDDLTLHDVDIAANRIRRVVAPDAVIIVGTAINPEMTGGDIRVSIVASGMSALSRQVGSQPGTAQPATSQQRHEPTQVPLTATEPFQPQPHAAQPHAPQPPGGYTAQDGYAPPQPLPESHQPQAFWPQAALSPAQPHPQGSQPSTGLSALQHASGGGNHSHAAPGQPSWGHASGHDYTGQYPVDHGPLFGSAAPQPSEALWPQASQPHAPLASSPVVQAPHPHAGSHGYGHTQPSAPASREPQSAQRPPQPVPQAQEQPAADRWVTADGVEIEVRQPHLPEAAVHARGSAAPASDRREAPPLQDQASFVPQQTASIRPVARRHAEVGDFHRHAQDVYNGNQPTSGARPTDVQPSRPTLAKSADAPHSSSDDPAQSTDPARGGGLLWRFTAGGFKRK